MQQIVTFVRLTTYLPHNGEQAESQISIHHIVAVQPFITMSEQPLPFDSAEATSVMVEGGLHFVAAMPYEQTVKAIIDAMSRGWRH